MNNIQELKNVYVIMTDWKDRQFEPEVVGIYASEDRAREVQNNKIMELQEEGYDVDEEVIVWFEETFIIE